MTEKMKPSGIAWIGDVPESWEICRIKDLCTIARGGSPRPIDEYLSDNPSDINWIRIGDTTKGNKYITQTEQKIIKQGISSSRMVYDGDLLLTNSMSFGQPYIMKTCGCIHDGWLVFSDYHRIDKLFLYYVLMSELCLVQFKTSVAGAVVENLSIDKVGISKIFLPSLEEQGAIVNFLDTQCAKIDSVIADIEKQIETLKKYKKSLITEAVTKGLDRSVPMKDSGIEWIGEIPSSWKVEPIKYHIDFFNGDRGENYPSKAEMMSEGVPFINAGHLLNDGLDMENMDYISEEKYKIMGGVKLRKGDILYCLRGSVGKNAILNIDRGTVASSLVALRSRSISAKFLYYSLNSHIEEVQRFLWDNGTAQPNLSAENLGKFKVCIPNRQEQDAIVEFLDEKCSAIDDIVESKTQALRTMQQHKKSLIYEYVTGKKRVTEVN